MMNETSEIVDDYIRMKHQNAALIDTNYRLNNDISLLQQEILKYKTLHENLMIQVNELQSSYTELIERNYHLETTQQQNVQQLSTYLESIKNLSETNKTLNKNIDILSKEKEKMENEMKNEKEDIDNRILMNKIIFNSDLIKNKYSEDILILHINNLNKRIVLNTQILSAEFCAKYIFCIDNIDNGCEDSYLFDINYILRKQKHIDREYLKMLISNNNL